MSILDDIGYLKNGKMEEAAIKGQINDMISISQTGSPKLAGISLRINIPDSDLSYLSMNDITLDQHEEKYPQFHKSYIGFTQTAVKNLNINPTNILKPIGITDPTQPLVELIKTIQSTVPGIPSNVDISMLIIQKLPQIMDPSILSNFTKLLIDLTVNNDLNNINTDVLEEVLGIALEDYPESLDNIKNSLEQDKTALLNKLKESVLSWSEITNGKLDLTANFSIFNLSFLGLDITEDALHLFNIQNTTPGVLGFYINFLKAMIAEITKIIASFQIPTEALKLIGYLREGIEGLKIFMIDKVLGPIKNALYNTFPDIEKYAIPVCYFAGFLKTIIKIIIVVIVGILLGPGLITFGIAKALELI